MYSTAYYVINEPSISLDRKILILEEFKYSTIEYIDGLVLRENCVKEYEDYLNFLYEKIQEFKEQRIDILKKAEWFKVVSI